VATIITNRKAIPRDMLDAVQVAEIDVIDIAGTAQVSDDFVTILTRSGAAADVRVRILLLDPYGQAATVRANESDYWNGDDTAMREKISRNAEKLAGMSLDRVSIEVRFYDEVPVSRFVRADGIVYQSYYPSSSSGKNVPIVRLDAEEVLAQRAIREFDVLWSTRARAAEPRSCTTMQSAGRPHDTFTRLT